MTLATITPPARDLADDLVTALEQTIPRYIRSIRQAVEQAEGEDRLTMQQLRCLQMMAAASGTALTTGLARRLQVAVPTMTRMLDGLAERGLIERQPDPTSRRQIRIVLTGDGRVPSFGTRRSSPPGSTGCSAASTGSTTAAPPRPRRRRVDTRRRRRAGRRQRRRARTAAVVAESDRRTDHLIASSPVLAGTTDAAIEVRDLTAGSTTSRRSTTCRLRLSRANSSGFSDRTARARARRSRCSAPSSGRLQVPPSSTAYDIVREPARVRESIGIVFQDYSLDDRITAEENLRFHCMIYHVPRAERTPVSRTSWRWSI